MRKRFMGQTALRWALAVAFLLTVGQAPTSADELRQLAAQDQGIWPEAGPAPLPLLGELDPFLLRPSYTADRDGDGISDRLDVLLGAKKVLRQGGRYARSYERLRFPMGDVARDRAVCADVVVRALRNAGIDLQQEVYRDIGRAPDAYPMVKRRDPNIDHRRVKTLLPYFLRHVAQHSPRANDPNDPVLPGDILFFDTMRQLDGPDHIGIASDNTVLGIPLVINALGERHPVSELPLLMTAPLTHRFRL